MEKLTFASVASDFMIICLLCSVRLVKATGARFGQEHIAVIKVMLSHGNSRRLSEEKLPLPETKVDGLSLAYKLPIR